MKGLYIYSTNDKDYKSNGESKKVLSQVAAFEEAGIEIKLFDIVLDKKIYKILYRLPFFGVYPKKKIKEISNIINEYDFVYIRKNIFDSTYLSLLKHIKKIKPQIKVFVEIPTYPYFQEWNRLIDKSFILKEKKVIRFVKENKLVDYYLTLSNDDYIFGIPTIKFENCISLKNYSIKTNVQKENELHLIGVALLATWHGYDRLIEGLHNYYISEKNQKKVYFHIVGEGNEFHNLYSLVEKYKLFEYVKFEGKKSGSELETFYNESQIAVSSLGMYRIGFNTANSLKSREYCAKGIPFIKGTSDTVFDNYKYSLTFPNDDSSIDVKKIIEFANEIDFDLAAKEMREFAKNNLDWGKFVSDIVAKI